LQIVQLPFDSEDDARKGALILKTILEAQSPLIRLLYNVTATLGAGPKGRQSIIFGPQSCSSLGIDLARIVTNRIVRKPRQLQLHLQALGCCRRRYLTSHCGS